MPGLVPLIDLAPWTDPAARTAIAQAVDAACRDVGFLQITGHGIPDEVIGEMRHAVDAFFALPLSEKLRWRSPSADLNRGYAAKGTEGLAYSLGMDESPPDLFEAFNIGSDANIWPAGAPGLEPALTAYFNEARRVAHLLTEIFAVALGLPEKYFEAFTGRSNDVVRVNYYERKPGEPRPVDGQMRMGAHSDYGIVTVLYADRVPSLQVLGQDGEWHDVIPEEGALLVNLGDLTAQWTNDRWRSTLHRVVPPKFEADGSVKRISVPFFHDGDDDALIECLPTCHDAENPPKYPPVTAGEHIRAKLMGPRLFTASEAIQTAGDRL